MKKIKLIMPIIELSTLAGIVAPAAVSCSPADPDVPVEDIQIRLDHEAIDLAPNASCELHATLEPETAGELVWDAGSEEDVSIDPVEGDKFARKITVSGDAEVGQNIKISVSLKDNPGVAPATCLIHVVEAYIPDTVKIEWDGETAAMNPGNQETFEAKVYDKDKIELTGFDLEWSLVESEHITLENSTVSVSLDAENGETATLTVTIIGYSISDKLTINVVAK